MKNHIKVNDQLLQTNKNWSHLKRGQQTWISDVSKEEYSRFIEENQKQPYKKSKATVIERVYDRICERGIWIPYSEAAKHISKTIDRQNRRFNLNTSEDGGGYSRKCPQSHCQCETKGASNEIQRITG